MRPLATLQRARRHRLDGPARAEATAMLVAALRRLGDHDLDAADTLLAEAHAQVRNSALLHTGVHVGQIAVALRRRTAGQSAPLALQPLAFAGVSSVLRRAAGVAVDAPQGRSLWATWQSRPRRG